MDASAKVDLLHPLEAQPSEALLRLLHTLLERKPKRRQRGWTTAK